MTMMVKVKVCGVRTLEAAQAAAESGAAMLGLVFYPPSPRYLAPTAAHELVTALNGLPNRPALVGLFVNVPQGELAAASTRYRLDYLQLSGDETPAQAREAARILPVLKTVRLPAGSRPEEALRLAADFGEIENVTLLLDTPKQGMYGGTGETGDWQAARAVAERYRTILAGGLHPGNVVQAVREVRPWGVDVSSGVEKTGQPGVKDPEKIKLFCKALEVEREPVS